jgi:membrane protease YdiL (CAAX protease family)
MKRCTYCGRENEESASICLECGTNDFDTGDVESVPSRAKPVSRFSSTSDEGVTWNRWDAWKYLGMVLVFEVTFSLVCGAAYRHEPGFRSWSREPVGFFLSWMVEAAIFVFTVLYFARTETFRSFVTAFRLNQAPNARARTGVLLVLALRWMGYVISLVVKTRGVPHTWLARFFHTVGPQRFFYIAPALLAPFWEEVVMRGFVYSAFRRSYSYPASIGLMIAVNAVTHLNQYSYSWVAALVLTCVTAILCYLREVSGSLWNCIICHFVFNLTGLLPAALFH